MIEHTPHHLVSPEGSSDRSFGLVFAIFFLLVALQPMLYDHDPRRWALVLSAAFGVVALAMPFILAPANRIWAKFGLLLHAIVSPVALGILFYGVVTPTGMLMRLLGKDSLCLRFDPSAQTYWIVRTPPGPDAESLKRQF